MSEEELNSYRFSPSNEPGDERLRQIMREAAEEARISNHQARDRFFAEIIGEGSKRQNNYAERVAEALAHIPADHTHRPLLIVIAGPNGAGKTTITSRLLKHEWLEDAEYVNPDFVARDRFGDWNNNEAVLKAANYCEKRREECLAQGRSLIFETVMSAMDKVDFILRAIEKGYFVRLFFIGTADPSINASRVAQRVRKGGHDVPIAKINSRYQKSIANCMVLAQVVDRLYVYDNSEENSDARLLFRLTAGRLAKRYAPDLPRWGRLLYPGE